MEYVEVENELRELKRLYENGDLKEVVHRFLVDYEYEDEYSHNQIEEMQDQFEVKAREYLEEVAPNEYIVCGGWAVFVKKRSN